MLIISNDCVSKQTSNGRTLVNFIFGWPKAMVAQFCIHFSYPDFSTCSNFFCVSDKDAFDSLWKRDVRTKQINTNMLKGSPKHSISRNSVSMLCRDIIWRIGFWKTKKLKNWLKEFSPKVILLQAGDCPFMYKIARDWSKKTQASLVIYNSEGYCFKDFDYFNSRGLSHYLYFVFHHLLKYEISKTLKIAKKSIYICDALKEDYDAEFHQPSKTIYTATNVQFKANIPSKSFRVCYLGNLGVGRHKSLIDIAESLQKISKNLVLEVYGNIPNDEVKKDFEQCQGIRYNGFVSYEKVIELMHNSDLLVHCESFDEFYRKDSKYAFSTKIADSLACGTPFLLYAPKEFAISKYLNENKAAFVVSEKAELISILNQIKNDFSFRTQYINSAISLVKRNHDHNQNALEFQKIILESIEAL